MTPPTVEEFARLVQAYGQARAEQARGERLHHAEKFEAAVVDAYRVVREKAGA